MSTRQPDSLLLLTPVAAALTRVTVTGALGEQIEQAEGTLGQGEVWSLVPATPLLFSPLQSSGGGYLDPVCRVGLATARMLRDRVHSASAELLACLVQTRSANAFTVALVEAARRNGRRLNGLLVAHAGWNVPAALLATELHSRGPTLTITGGSPAGHEALETARMMLACGRAEAALVTAAELSHVSQLADGQMRAEAVCLSVIATKAKPESHFFPDPISPALWETLPWQEVLPADIVGMACRWQEEGLPIVKSEGA